MYWEDRLNKEQVGKVNAALKKFGKTKKRGKDKDILYDELCGAGLNSEEADEFCNLGG